MNRFRIFLFLLVWPVTSLFSQEFMTVKATDLQNKIKGGWAGQTIGVTYGAPVEFRYQGTMINDYQKLNWYDGLLKKSMVEWPGIYDDLYLDITFVEVFEKEGLDAPSASHARSVADAGYMLWHANQAARYNVLNGKKSPQSGYWLNNPHADCIDFQIEADFAGLMSPFMPATASVICDTVGHIMNYGDGWYGGVYIATMYSLAFGSNDVQYVVEEALKAIPEKTRYHACISDVIKWHKQYPGDWKSTWFEIQKKWTDDIGCPEGVFSQFNIDATVNSAYVVLGLLYGNGDFSRTVEITARAGQDADCNPSTAAGILGVMLGYTGIPEYWKMGLHEIEDMDFKYTHTSLNKVYRLSYVQAIENIERHGGKVDGNNVMIKKQNIKPVRWEQSFSGLYPVERSWIGKNLTDEHVLEFTGNGIVINGQYKFTAGTVPEPGSEKVAQLEISVDGMKPEKISMPLNFTTRKNEIYWNYQLANKKHIIRLKLLNPDPKAELFIADVIYYSEPNRK
ncbi:MAG: ADP-ribosylglycohydrolase family protein [Cyclobacteriaceae bacterium]|nr:ADP-ribosylglycohydrolase family protein [Cyclobacteriaceae bacterium]